MKFLPALLLLALLPARVNAQSTTTTTTVVKQVTPTPDLRVLSLGVLQAPAVYALEAVAVRPAVVTEEAELDPETLLVVVRTRTCKNCQAVPNRRLRRLLHRYH